MTKPQETVAFDDSSFNNLLKTSKISVHNYSLKVIQGSHKQKDIPLNKELFYIGRAEWCDLVIKNDLRVSSNHCLLQLDSIGLKVLDQGSLNGVYLEGQRVIEAYMSKGARLQIGETILQLQSHQSPKEIEVGFFDKSGRLIGRSPQMRKIFSLMSRVAPRGLSILLTGETGTGKSSVAEAIHAQSKYSKGDFVVVNCAALASSMIEASLFGHEKGAFTDAKQRHQGYFEQAHHGTLFLDEIGELPLELQPKLLDVLERRKVRRLGGHHEIEVDFQLITATNINLRQAVKKGLFREDLYYRLSVVELEIPPLRERPEDIVLLARMMLDKLNQGEIIKISEQAQQALQRHLWPGNVRQLRNTLERTMAFLDNSIINLEDLYLPPLDDDLYAVERTKTNIQTQSPVQSVVSLTDEQILSDKRDSYQFIADLSEPISLKKILADTEKDIITQALKKHDWNVLKTAKFLSISKAWFYERMKHHNIKRPK